MHHVDEVGSEEVADDRRSAADTHVEVASGLLGKGESFLWRRVDKVEHRVALHFDGRTRMVRQHEHRRVKRWIGPPPATPLVVPSELGPRPGLRTKLAPTHD